MDSSNPDIDRLLPSPLILEEPEANVDSAPNMPEETSKMGASSDDWKMDEQQSVSNEGRGLVLGHMSDIEMVCTSILGLMILWIAAIGVKNWLE
jgi:hypothetical protein